jgi:hypothetical protein
MALVKDHQSTVVVSQSWNEIHQVNDAIRVALKIEKLVGDVETDVTTFQPVDLTTAQKRDARSYTPETVLVFNRDVRGFKAGELARLKQITDTHLIVESDTRIALISFDHLEKLTVCQSREMALAAGDRLQLKANGRSVENRKLVNGELVTVKMIRPDGRIALKDGRVLAKNFRQFVRGYAITSYAAQGKSVDHVLFSDSLAQAATSQQQWYVTISRGKKGIHIFTTDKEQLRENITRSADRPSVMDLLAAHYQNDWFYRQIEQRWGQRAAVIMTQNRRAQEFEAIRRKRMQTQRVTVGQKVKRIQIQAEAPKKQSHGVRV